MASAIAHRNSTGRFVRNRICVYLLPTEVLPLPADVLQRLSRLPVQLRCPTCLTLCCCHITERDPRTREVADRLHRGETVRRSLERSFCLIDPAERQCRAAHHHSSVPYFFSVFLARSQ